MNIKVKSVLALICVVFAIGASEAKTIRATEMDRSLWSRFSKGTLSDIVIEFRHGDELPVTFTAEGDLLETTQHATSYIGVKRNFWLRMEQANVKISFDGVTFTELNEALEGSFQVGTGSDQGGGVAKAITLSFQAFLK